MDSYTLPPTAQIAAALDDLLENVTRMLRPLEAASRVRALDTEDHKELRHWRNQERAALKALAQLEKLELTRRGWGIIVGSASRPGDVRHGVRREGGLWVCGCEAGVKAEPGLSCWHITLALAIDMAEDTAERDRVSEPELAYRSVREGSAELAYVAAPPSGKSLAQLNDELFG